MKTLTTKNLLLMFFCSMIFYTCKKDRYIFTMKTVRLNSYDKSQLPDQNIYIKVVDTDTANVLASTETYPGNLTLPVTFNLKPHPEIHLYKNDHIVIQLWGDLSGLIASSTIHMKEYKIQFPIDMETKEGTVSFSVMGTWE